VIAVIDNYDSFTYNLVQLFGEMGEEMLVLRNDAFTVEELAARKPSAIVISPGPGRPDAAGQTLRVIAHFAGRTPILGICLGHQAIGQSFGAEIVRAGEPAHGKEAEVRHFGDPLFAGIPSPFQAARYHSLVVARETFPDCLQLIAETADGIVMALRHRQLPLIGLQFHPESVITPQGRAILKNFLGECRYERNSRQALRKDRSD
jgi:anthranilate synthase/aminodeoxychorismate synthase-like glutamine amidotransferase